MIDMMAAYRLTATSWKFCAAYPWPFSPSPSASGSCCCIGGVASLARCRRNCSSAATRAMAGRILTGCIPLSARQARSVWHSRHIVGDSAFASAVWPRDADHGVWAFEDGCRSVGERWFALSLIAIGPARMLFNWLENGALKRTHWHGAMRGRRQTVCRNRSPAPHRTAPWRRRGC